MYVCARALMDVFGHIIFNCFIFSTSVFFPPFYSILVFLFPSTRLFFSFFFFIVPYYTREDRILPYDGGLRSITTRWYIVIIITSHRRPANHLRPSRRTFVFFFPKAFYSFWFSNAVWSRQKTVSIFSSFFFVLVFISRRCHACFYPPTRSTSDH